MLREYYPLNYTSNLITKLSEKGVTVNKRALYGFFHNRIHRHGSVIMGVSLDLIREAQAHEKELAKEVGKLAGVQDLNTQRIAS